MQSLCVFNSPHPLVVQAQEWLYLVQRKGHVVNFCWVPAHVDVSGNERADQLARDVVHSAHPRLCPVPFRDIFPIIRKGVLASWSHCWETLPGTNRKMRAIARSTTPWAYSSMPRRWETALCRLRIGHTRLTHSFLMSRDNPPYCDDCIVPLTVEHILCECPSFLDERRQFLNYGRDERGVFSLKSVLCEDGDFTICGLFGFLTQSGLLNKL